VITNSSTPAANPAASAAASAAANPSTNTSAKSSTKSSNISPGSGVPVSKIIAISTPNPGSNVAIIQNDDDIEAFVINSGTDADIAIMKEMLADGRISDANIKFTKGECTVCTALMHQSRKGTIKAMEFLLENGAKVNLQDKHGDTALHYILLENETDDTVAKVELLLEKGAKVDIKNSDGKTALEKAKDIPRTRAQKAIEDFIKQPNATSPDNVILAVAGNAIN
jgi:ankyrin repeat protein